MALSRPTTSRRQQHRLLEVDRAHPMYLFTVCVYHCFLRHLSSPSDLPESNESDFQQVDRIQTSLQPNNEQNDAKKGARLSAISRRRVSVHAGGFYGGGGNGLLSSEASPLFLLGKKWSHLDVEFVVFAPKIFNHLREEFGIGHEDYLNSVAPLEGFVHFLQYGSHSKRPLLFTHDRRFVLKVESASSVSRIGRVLPSYVKYLMSSPHSLIVKLLGVYAIKIDRNKPIYFTVMQSVFWPSSGIRERFELKGCVANRHNNANSGNNGNGSDAMMTEDMFVGLDQNFIGTPIALGTTHNLFIEQLRRDLDFLASQKLYNYCLLIGLKPMVSEMPDVKENNNEPLMRDIKKNGFVPPMRRLSSGVLEDLDHNGHDDEKEKDVEHLEHDDLDTTNENKRDINKVQVKNGIIASKKKSSVVRVRQVRFRVEGDRVASSRSATPYFQLHAPPRDALLSADKENKDDNEGSARNKRSNSIKRMMGKLLRSRSAKTAPISDFSKSSTRPATSHVTSFTSKAGNEASTSTLRSVRVSTSKRILNEMMDRIEVVPDTRLEENSEDEFRSFAMESRRVVGGTHNALHIVDGEEHTYFFGLVNIFEMWDSRAKAIGALKDLLYCSSSHNCVQPDIYADRLHDFVHLHCL